MSLEQKIMTDLKAAMLARDEAALRGLRAIKSAILLAKTSGTNELTEGDEVKLLQKLVKQRKESVDIYIQQNRADLAKGEQDEIAVIEKFLPSMMSEEEVKNAVQTIIKESGASTAADLGKVMGLATKQLAGKADNKLVAALVRQFLG